jgi:hypothetical protein
MSRKHITWAYLGNKACPLSELTQDALEHPDLTFSFADSEDRARVRRQIESALRITTSDRELLEIAVKLKINL